MSDPPLETLKTCAYCGGIFSLSAFYINKKTGKPISYCVQCQTKKNKEYNETHNERIKAYRKTTQNERTLSSIKKRAKDKGLDFDLEVEDLLGDVCPVFGVKLIRGSKQGPSDFAPSVDRKDNSKGYVKGNVQVLSNLANKMKANATPEQLVQFAEWVLKTYKH